MIALCHPGRGKWVILISTCCWVLSCVSLVVLAGPGPTTPPITSTVLKIQKFYMTNPPHDTKLYDILHVSPNATSTQITKSYRTLAKKFHPDKLSTTTTTTTAAAAAAAAAAASTTNAQFSDQQFLQQIQDAYDILKDDSTRLPYHQYGLTDPNVAVALLLGPHHHASNHLLDKAHDELLQLMGYEWFSSSDHYHYYHHHSALALDAASRQEERIRYIAARLVERLRPLVEESVSTRFIMHQWARDCDEWKRLPLGAQIVRCIGRAYRHAGRDYLSLLHGRRGPNQQLSLPPKKVVNYYSVPVRQQWRKAKAFWTAVLATGKATVTEKVWMQQEQQRRWKKQKQQEKLQKRKNKNPQIDYYSQGLGELSFGCSDNEDDDNDDRDSMFSSDEDEEDFDEEEMKYMEQFRAKQTLLTSLQVDALWKVAKIDLDRVIRRACHLILTREYFFDPSHQILLGHDLNTAPPTDGWVTRQGKLIDSDEALQRTAKALILLGDVMVERSKVETSWKD